MVKQIDRETRNRAILSATINRYIEKGNPVSSEEIAKAFSLSSATVRNVFAELEKAGYLTHPYTSGGRIPTNKGYRYYVDFLVAQMELFQEEKERITNEYNREVSRLEDVLERTSEVISGITHYAGIASFSGWEGKLFYKGLSLVLNQPEFNDLQRIRLFVNLLEEKQQLLGVINRNFSDKVKVYIGDELDCPGINDCSLIVSTYHQKRKPVGKVAVLGPMRMEYKHTISALEYISDILTEILDSA